MVLEVRISVPTTSGRVGCSFPASLWSDDAHCGRVFTAEPLRREMCKVVNTKAHRQPHLWCHVHAHRSPSSAPAHWYRLLIRFSPPGLAAALMQAGPGADQRGEHLSFLVGIPSSMSSSDTSSAFPWICGLACLCGPKPAISRGQAR